MIIRLFAFIIIVTMSAFNGCNAQECGGPTQPLSYSEFFTKDYSGRIAWIPSAGEETYYPLDDCTTLAFRRDERAYFIINNLFKPRDGDGKASFLTIQVAKTQTSPQRDRDVNLDRNEQWCHEVKSMTECADRVTQSGFSAQPIAGLSPKQFFDLHVANEFDESKLTFGKLYWHGTPVGGAVSSKSLRKRLNWANSMFDEQPDKVLLLNRLYGFQFNPKENTGVDFDVGIRGTQSIAIRIVSPLWSEASEYLIRVKRLR